MNNGVLTVHEAGLYYVYAQVSGVTLTPCASKSINPNASPSTDPVQGQPRQKWLCDRAERPLDPPVLCHDPLGHRGPRHVPHIRSDVPAAQRRVEGGGPGPQQTRAPGTPPQLLRPDEGGQHAAPGAGIDGLAGSQLG